MPETRLTYLLVRYFKNESSPLETEELMVLLNDPANDKAVQAVLDESWAGFNVDVPVFSAERSRVMLDHVLTGRKIQAGEPGMPPVWDGQPAVWDGKKETGGAEKETWDGGQAAWNREKETWNSEQGVVLAEMTEGENISSGPMRQRGGIIRRMFAAGGSGARMRGVAAAVIIACVLSGYWWMTRRSPAKGPVMAIQHGPVHDAKPGTNGAVLTLGDGSTIQLDSAGVGMLSMQGGTKLVRQAGGRLTYEEGGDNQRKTESDEQGKAGVDGQGQSGTGGQEDHGAGGQRQSGVGGPENATAADGKPLRGQGRAVLYNTLTTARGKQFQVVLPDGTKVWLNAQSSLRYPTAFTGKERRVEIEGEAYFEVAHDVAKPFLVESGGQEIRVLGTRFNVNAYTDEGTTRTTLLDGAVQVNVNHGAESLLLKPGQQAQVNGVQMKRVTNVDSNGVMAWKNGFFSFRHSGIRMVTRQLARWYDVDVEYRGSVDEGQSFSGEIGRDLLLSDVLKGLQLTRIHYRIEDKKLIILP